MIEIIHVGGNDGEPPILDAESKKRVRSNAMKHFRRQQKGAREDSKMCASAKIV